MHLIKNLIRKLLKTLKLVMLKKKTVKNIKTAIKPYKKQSSSAFLNKILELMFFKLNGRELQNWMHLTKKNYGARNQVWH